MTGRATIAGHFGEWVQGRLGPGGEVVLVTLACPALKATARCEATGATHLTGDIAAVPPDALLRLGGERAGRVRLTLDMPPGGGAGASTAALVALSRVVGVAETDLPAVCLSVEGATDPLMLDRPDAVLWAPRRAATVEPLPPPPEAEIVGGFLGDGEMTDPADLRFPDVEDLVRRWREGPDLAGAAAVATTSAGRTTALRGPAGDPTEALARRCGALGWIRAHTGSARGLIFPPGGAPGDVEATLGAAGLTGVLRFRTGGRA